MQQKGRADVRAHAAQVLSRLLEEGLPSPVLGELATLISDFDNRVIGLGDEELELARLSLTQQMAFSRADKTAEVCSRLAEAIENGTASKAEQAQEVEILQRLELARDHSEQVWDELGADLREAGDLADELFAETGRLEAIISKMRSAIEVAEELLRHNERERLALDMYARKKHSYDFCAAYDRQVAAYFEAPIDMDEEWDLVFMRIQAEELEIRPPSEKVPHYHVPGIVREDLERLTHPFFKKRSQARLQAMLEIRQLNQRRKAQRGRRAAEGSPLSSNPIDKRQMSVTRAMDRLEHQPGADSPSEPQSQAVVSEPCEMTIANRDSHYRRLHDYANVQVQSARNDALDEFVSWFRDEYAGRPFPARFDHGNLMLEIERLPSERRQFAEVFAEQIPERISALLEPERISLRHILLGAEVPLVRIEEEKVIFNARDARINICPNASLLLGGDPVVRGYIAEHMKNCAVIKTQNIQREPEAREPALRPTQLPERRASCPDRDVSSSEDLASVELAWQAARRGMER